MRLPAKGKMSMRIRNISSGISLGPPLLMRGKWLSAVDQVRPLWLPLIVMGKRLGPG
jgi:hypothetical protein